MSTINKVVLLGNVGSVEVKEFDGGKKLVQVSLATTDGYKKGEEWINKTEWHKCIMAIPALAERACTINKGDKIYVEGSISTNSWTDKDGNKKETKEISCTTFKTFQKAVSTIEQGATPSVSSSTASTQGTSLDAIDDLPF